MLENDRAGPGNLEGNWQDIFVHKQVPENLVKVNSEANCPWYFDFYGYFEKLYLPEKVDF